MTVFRELTRTKGTGDVALAGRAPGAVAWAGSGKNGQNVRYSITENGNVEIGTGLYSGNILQRSAVQETIYNGVHTTSGATPIPLDGGAVVDLLVTNEVTIRKSAFGQVFDVETEDPAEVVVKARTSPGGGNRIPGRYDPLDIRPRYPAGYTKAPLRSYGMPTSGLDEKTVVGATVSLAVDAVNTYNGQPVIQIDITGTPTGAYMQVGRTTADYVLDTDGQDIANRSIVLAVKIPNGMPAPTAANLYLSDATFTNYARYVCPLVGVSENGYHLFQKEVVGATQLVGTLPPLSGGLRTRVRIDFAANVIAGQLKMTAPNILPLPKPTIVWTNDDGYSEWMWLAAEARKRGLDLSFGISYTYINTPGFLTDAEVLALQNEYGHEVTNHAGPNVSYLESNLTTYMGHVNACTQYLLGLGINPKTVALHQYVKGHEDATLRNAMKDAGFVACRSTNTGYKAARSAAFALGGPGIDGLFNIPNCINLSNGTDLATVKTQLTHATKIGAAFIVGHRYEAAIGDTTWLNSYDPSYGVLSLMDWLAERRDVDGWQIKTWRQWYDDLYDTQCGMTL